MFFERPEAGNKAVVLHTELTGRSAGGTAVPELGEFLELARSAELEVVRVVSATREQPHPRWFVGAGKVQELREELQGLRKEIQELKELIKKLHKGKK